MSSCACLKNDKAHHHESSIPSYSEAIPQCHKVLLHLRSPTVVNKTNISSMRIKARRHDDLCCSAGSDRLIKTDFGATECEEFTLTWGFTEADVELLEVSIVSADVLNFVDTDYKPRSCCFSSPTWSVKRFTGSQSAARRHFCCCLDHHIGSILSFFFFPSYGSHIAVLVKVSSVQQCGRGAAEQTVRLGQAGPLFSHQEIKMWDLTHLMHHKDNRDTNSPRVFIWTDGWKE